MKASSIKRWTVGLAIVPAFFLLPTSYAAADILAHWKLDGDFTDAAHNYDGTLFDPGSNGVAWTSGEFGQAIDLRSPGVGYTDHVNTGLDLDGTPKTMVFHAKPQSFSGNWLWAGNSSGGSTRFYLGAYGQQVWLGAGGSGSHSASYTWPPTPTTEFHHYALVDDQSSGNQVKAYQDGVLIHTLPYSGSTAGTNFTIGDVRGENSNAALDDVAVFDTALDAADIQYIAQHGVEGYVMQSWKDAGWDYRQEVTVSSAVTNSNLTEFPVLVKISDPTNPIFTHAQADGDDILFTDANGNQLAHEIESYSAGTGELAAWVKANVSADYDTKLQMYYGNSGAADQQNATGTWDGSFQMVQHFDETSGTHVDSTSNNYVATVTGANMDAAGKINGADHFDGSGDYVELGYGAGIDPSTAPHTFSMWVKSENPTAGDIFFSSGQSAANDRMYMGHTNDKWDMGIRSSGWGSGAADVTAEWTYLSLVMDGSQARLYVNGELGKTRSYTPYSLLQDIYVGRHPTSGSSYDFTGLMDEIRISTTDRSLDWIMASYLTQLYGSGEQYVTFGGHVALPEPASATLLGLAMLSLVAVSRRRRRR